MHEHICTLERESVILCLCTCICFHFKMNKNKLCSKLSQQYLKPKFKTNKQKLLPLFFEYQVFFSRSFVSFYAVLRYAWQYILYSLSWKFIYILPGTLNRGLEREGCSTGRKHHPSLYEFNCLGVFLLKDIWIVLVYFDFIS